MSKFSFFNGPITNTTPLSTIDIEELYTLICSNKYEKLTKTIRSSPNTEMATAAKRSLDYVTLGGVFEKRNTSALISASGYMMLDIDNLNNPESWMQFLSKVQCKYRILLMFISPSGNGLKVAIELPKTDEPYPNQFDKVSTYFYEEFFIDIDSTPDIARACFLCHDPNAYVCCDKGNYVSFDNINRR